MSSLGALIPDDAQAPGYCSSSTRPLTASQITRVVAAASSGGGAGISSVFTEKDLVGKGTRKLVVLQEGSSSRFTFVEYAGVRKAKFVSADAKRYEAMIDGALEKLGESFDDINATNTTKVVLLKENGTICRRNTLTRLHGNGIVVMRCTNDDGEEESDSEESG